MEEVLGDSEEAEAEASDWCPSQEGTGLGCAAQSPSAHLVMYGERSDSSNLPINVYEILVKIIHHIAAM